MAYPVYYFFKRSKTSYYNRPAPNFFYNTDPILGYTLKEYLAIKQPPPRKFKNAPRKKEFFDVQTNRHGFRYRDDLTKDKPAGETRIFCLGGSTTMGAESSNKMTYPQQLEDMIDDPTIRIINAGVGGYRSIHLLYYYKELLRDFSPDIITIYSGWNDYAEYLSPYWNPRDPLSHVLLGQFTVTQHPITKFALGHLLIKTYYRLTNYDRVELQTSDPETKDKYMKAAVNPAWQEEYRTNMQELISIAKSDGVIPALIIFPSPHFENAPFSAKDFADKDLGMTDLWDPYVISLGIIREILKQLAIKNDIPIIDVNKRFEEENHDIKKKFSYFVDKMHLTPKGNTLIAKTMAPSIKNILTVLNQRALPIK